MRIYWIEELNQGMIGIMARPRGNDWLETEIQKLYLEKIDWVISLLEKPEISELELEQEGELCKKYGMSFLNFPIKDRSIPQDNHAFISLIESICHSLEQGHKIVVHCRMGIGRASLVAAGIMLKTGVQPSQIFERISSYRKLKVPDTKEQVDWFSEIAEDL